MGGHLSTVAWIVGLAAFIVFVALVGGGFWLISRRKSAANPSTDSQKRANILLVQVDDLVKDAANELDFAFAQFGEARTRDFKAAIDTAKISLAKAFSLQQQLDDAFPDSEIKRQDWISQIIHLCETSRASIQAQEQAFVTLRGQEENAPESLENLETAIAAASKRSNSVETIAGKLRSNFDPAAVASIADNLQLSAKELSAAKELAAKAGKQLAKRSKQAGGALESESQSPTVPELIQSASIHLSKSEEFLSAIEHLDSQLQEAVAAVRSLKDSTAANLAEARSLRDAPPDATSSDQIAESIKLVEAALATDPKIADPLATLETLRAANASLDSSMAGARNQQRRLEGARTALVGAMVAAKSQLAATDDYINARRSGVGAEARVRLAEADRLLKVAAAESDPVAALDIARRSATLSRDADALARFDLMRR
ncbi:MAG: hypothetical protein KF867_08025 [Cryobacterium sp.]|nr:hypothetical protein [Cryobacterium sp.]